MTKSSFLFALLGWAGLAPAASAGVTPALVADIDPRFSSAGSMPHDFVSLNGRVMFVAGEDDDIRLWSTAGVPGDPVRLGPDDLTAVYYGPSVAGSLAYFTGCTTGGACGLWATGGTSAGTRRLFGFAGRSFQPVTAVAPAGLPHTLVLFTASGDEALWRTDGTPGGSRRVGMAATRLRDLVSFRGKGWFFADLPNADGALFSTNGLPGGTKRVGAATEGRRPLVVGDHLLFLAGDDGEDLWSSDGTPAGTRKLGTFSLLDDSIAVAQGRAFFIASTPSGDPPALWITDGTVAGTRKILALSGGSGRLVPLGGKVAFTNTDPTAGTELWMSDGTAAGTRRVKDLWPGPDSGVTDLGISSLGRIWFAGTTPRGSELWTSDLTPAGTRLVRDLCRGSCGSAPRGWLAAGGRVYFIADGTGFFRGIWGSDGTAAGTVRVNVSDFGQQIVGASLANSKVVLEGFDETRGSEPWVTNGTLAGTRLLADLDSDNLYGSDPLLLGAAGGRLFFLAFGHQLWVSDGTEAGTLKALDQVPGFSPQIAASEADGRLVLFAESGLIGSDGTPAGSGPLLPEGTTAEGRFLRAGDRLFFLGADPMHGLELWVTDGTPGGTLRLTDFVPPSPFRPKSGPPGLLALGDKVVVPVLSPLGGEELWISDGTPGGTQPLHANYPFLEEPLAAALAQPAPFAGSWYFLSSKGEQGAANLWRTDLTQGGTTAVRSLALSNPAAGTWRLYPLPHQLLAFGRSTVLGDALWTSDGSAAGTHVVGETDLRAEVEPAVFDQRLWFQGAIGRLWVTDGTAEGTRAFSTDPERPIEEPLALHVVGDRLVIASLGEFLATDGTEAGTTLIDFPGEIPNFNTFRPLGINGRMFFPWNDLQHGPELWVIRPE
jgi:ELWxxDGT repeat protein